MLPRAQNLACHFPLFGVPYAELHRRLWESGVKIRVTAARDGVCHALLHGCRLCTS